MIKVGDVYIRNGYQLDCEPYIIIIISIFGDRIIYRSCVDQAIHGTTGMYITDISKYFEKVP